MDLAIVQGVDAVIHCEWDLDRGPARQCHGEPTLMDAARRAGAVRQLFISTCSAHPAAVTERPDQARRPQWMLDGRHAVARLGVTIGRGGIYRRMSDTLAQHRVVPLIDGGRGLVPIVGIADLGQALAAIVERGRTGLFHLFNLSSCLSAIPCSNPQSGAAPGDTHARASERPAGAALAEEIGVNLPLDGDNVRALRANYGVRGARSHRLVAHRCRSPRWCAQPSRGARLLDTVSALGRYRRKIVFASRPFRAFRVSTMSVPLSTSA